MLSRVTLTLPGGGGLGVGMTPKGFLCITPPIFDNPSLINKKKLEKCLKMVIFSWFLAKFGRKHPQIKQLPWKPNKT